MNESLIKCLEKVTSKVTSARFIVTLAVTMTFCSIINGMTGTYISALSSGTELPAGVKEIMMLLIGGFLTTVSSITTYYFMKSRQDGSK